MPLSGDADPAGEVPSPTRSPHTCPPTSHRPPFRGARRRGSGDSRNLRRCRGWGRSPAEAARHTHASSALAAPGLPAARPSPSHPRRLPPAGLGRAGRTPAPRSPAEVDQARHKLPGAFTEASRTGRPPAPFPRGPAAAPAPTPHTGSPGGDRPEAQSPHPSGAPEFTSKSRPLFLKFLSRWLSSFSLSAMAGPVTPSPARAPRDPPQPPRRTDTPRNRAAA